MSSTLDSKTPGQILITSLLLPLSIGAGGAWMGVEVSLARVEERLQLNEQLLMATQRRVEKLENVNSDHIGGPLSEHREFRERITRLEEQVHVLQKGH